MKPCGYYLLGHLKWVGSLFVLVALMNDRCVDAQIPTPPIARPEAVYTPAPVYRPEWAKQGLAGKGMVQVTIDPKTGSVTGAKMIESTGNQLLDGAALQAYSQWRFKPGSVSQLRIPIEFRKGPPPGQPAGKKPPQPMIYILLILVGFALATFMRRRRGN